MDEARGDPKADNLHELMRVREALNIQQVAKITATAALARKDSRFPPIITGLTSPIRTMRTTAVL